MTDQKCVLNGCTNPQGSGTHVSVDGVEGILPVCEEHWQANRLVPAFRQVRPSVPLKETAEGLVQLLREAGNNWGPLGVALAALQLVDEPSYLILPKASKSVDS